MTKGMTEKLRLVEDFLRAEHAKDYHGCDDDMPDAFEEWIDNLEPDDWIELMAKFSRPPEKGLRDWENIIDELESKTKNSIPEDLKSAHTALYHQAKEKLRSHLRPILTEEEMMRIMRSNLKKVYFKKNGKTEFKIHGFEKASRAIMERMR